MIIAWVIALLSIASGAGGYFAAEAMFETVDFPSMKAWFIVKTWAARNTEVIYTGAIGTMGVDVDGGVVYVADGQIIHVLFIEDYAPVTPFTIHTIMP